MAEGEKTFAPAKDLKPGRYIIIDDIPCKVVDMDISKPGKHGAAKVRITAIGIFDGQKKTWLGSADMEVESPVIKKLNAQVISISGESVQLMDKETYEMFEVTIPEEFKGQLEGGKDVELMESMGRKAIVRVYKG